MILWTDLETRSPVSIKDGVYRYAEHAEIILVAWSVDEGPIHVEEKVSDAFLHAAQCCDRAIAHNDEFERTILSHTYPWMGLDFPWYCTMRQARRHGLPGALDKLCDILGIEENKRKKRGGKNLIQIFCVPRKDQPEGVIVYNDKHSHPKEWAEFVEYGGGDVVAMKEVHRIVPKWNDEVEAEITHLDAVINARGFAVDVPFAKKVVATLKTDAAKLADKVYAATDGQVESATKRDQLLKYILAEYGVDLPDMQAATLERRIQDELLPEGVRELLRLRLLSSKTSTAKYGALLKCVSQDERLRGTMAYAGAMRTARWAGQKFQPHNLPRLPGGVSPEDVQFEIECMQLDTWEMLCERGYSDMAATAVRGCVIAGPGKKLVVGDYANIEGRILAWLAGEEWKLQAFRDYDAGIGPDLYKLAYARAFGISHEKVTKHQRQIGKVLELLMGYQGRVNAFITGAATYRIDLDEMAKMALPEIPVAVYLDAQKYWQFAENMDATFGLNRETFIACDSLVRLWRKAHPKTEALWTDLSDAVMNVVRVREGEYQVGKLTIDLKGVWLRVRLPSGRYLLYPSPKIEMRRSDGRGEDEEGAEMARRRATLTFMGVNQFTKQWDRLKTYGGSETENADQGIARDVLANGLIVAEKRDYPIVLHVHDEGVAEVEEERPLQPFLDALGTLPSWATGLPLAVAGFKTKRYRKE